MVIEMVSKANSRSSSTPSMWAEQPKFMIRGKSSRVQGTSFEEPRWPIPGGGSQKRTTSEHLYTLAGWGFVPDILYMSNNLEKIGIVPRGSGNGADLEKGVGLERSLSALAFPWNNKNKISRISSGLFRCLVIEITMITSVMISFTSKSGME